MNAEEVCIVNRGIFSSHLDNLENLVALLSRQLSLDTDDSNIVGISVDVNGRLIEMSF